MADATKKFETSHKLSFETRPWFFSPDEWQQFRVGTCGGLWHVTDSAYQILAIINMSPNDGHFDDVLEWFENSCRRDGKCLEFLELLNESFSEHLIKKRGFIKCSDVLRKVFSSEQSREDV